MLFTIISILINNILSVVCAIGFRATTWTDNTFPFHSTGIILHTTLWRISLVLNKDGNPVP